MGDIIGSFLTFILPITIRVAFWASVVFTFIPVLALLTSALLVGLNGSVLQDIFYMVQMWLPFNLNVIMIWALTISGAFVAWYLAKKAEYFINKLLNGKQQF